MLCFAISSIKSVEKIIIAGTGEFRNNEYEAIPVTGHEGL
jgi:hypothetical protein